jgi:RHH-type proline utilization regulon transcriptional repressor/proline dehydrogenase/delta 1-pyrroline-5-carboxylate dehydrogenase
VVGVQPFGGHGYSGTGPKAGGPLYLYRLVRAENVPRLDGEPVPIRFDALEALRTALPQVPDLTDGQRRLLVTRLDTYRDRSPLQVKLTLPGPTGERNTLHFLPRGTVGCHAEALPHVLEQLAAAWATGNRALLPDSDDGRKLVRIIDHPDIAFVRDLVDADIQALLFAGNGAHADRLRRRLAARPGPLVPLIGEQESGGYDLHRLILEKTVSVNTTAAGGNAALMSLPG